MNHRENSKQASRFRLVTSWCGSGMARTDDTPIAFLISEATDWLRTDDLHQRHTYTSVRRFSAITSHFFNPLDPRFSVSHEIMAGRLCYQSDSILTPSFWISLVDHGCSSTSQVIFPLYNNLLTNNDNKLTSPKL